MANYRSVFPKQNTFLAVIHAENEVQAMQNIAIAHDNGADGVFLINHTISPDVLVGIYASARMAFPTFWIGMNMLGIHPLLALSRIPDNKGGLWVDDAGIKESGENTDARRFLDACSVKSHWKGLYFGGVAFKYQRAVKDFGHVARLAVPFVDVVTTSGDGTGIAPDIEKIRVMKEAIGTHPLAIASGITPENASQYLEWADCILVATGISDSHTKLNPSRVARLAKVLPS